MLPTTSRTPSLVGWAAALAALAVLDGCVARPTTSPPASSSPPEPTVSSPLSSPRIQDYEWMSIAEWERRRQRLLDIPRAEREAARVVFLGDSITEGWDDAVWNAHFARFGALRLGIGGDTTAHLLYRIENGELAHTRPAAAVVLIGTNDLGNEATPPERCAAGIRAVVGHLRERWPDATIVLLALLPRDQTPSESGRRAVSATNPLIADLATDPQVRFLDLSDRLLEPDGTIAPSVMADFLHPTPLGYERIATALDPLLEELVETR